MRVKSWNCYYDEEVHNSFSERIVDAVSLWIAIGLLWFAFINIINEHFEVPFSNQPEWLVIVPFLVLLWLPSSGFLSQQKDIILIYIALI